MREALDRLSSERPRQPEGLGQGEVRCELAGQLEEQATSQCVARGPHLSHAVKDANDFSHRRKYSLGHTLLPSWTKRLS